MSCGQEELEELIACPKRVIKPSHKDMKLERGNWRNDFTLEPVDDGTDDKMGFSVFMRKNERFPENFSIGLNVQMKGEKSFCLLRCNGPHGDHVNSLLDPVPHYGFHIHKAKSENMEDDLSPERYAELTDDYGSYEEALLHFLKKVNIVNADEYFKKTGENNGLS